MVPQQTTLPFISTAQLPLAALATLTAGLGGVAHLPRLQVKPAAQSLALLQLLGQLPDDAEQA
jgi:hypothetical protein